jgi:putative hydrolase of the HAD superfamily
MDQSMAGTDSSYNSTRHISTQIDSDKQELAAWTDQSISVIALDIANTLEVVATDQGQQVQASQAILDLLSNHGVKVPLGAGTLRETLRTRFRKFHCWRVVNMRELPMEVVWTEWLLPDQQREIVESIADRLTELWLGVWYSRSPVRDSQNLVLRLKERGYRLACISNSMSTAFTMHCLATYGLADLFEVVVLSSDVGFRKPHPRIFNLAAERLGTSEESICYVGDQLARDVVGAINAGYGASILIGNESAGSWHDEAVVWPDLKIAHLNDLRLYFD